MTIEELKSNLDGIVTKVTNLEGAAVKAADIEALKSQIAGIKVGMTAEELKNDPTIKKLDDTINELNGKIEAMSKKGGAPTMDLKDAIKEVLEKDEVKSIFTSNKAAGMQTFELKAATSNVTGTIAVTDMKKDINFPRLRALSFLPLLPQGMVGTDKNRIGWIEGTYTSNVGYVGEATAQTTADAMTAVEKTRALAKASAKIKVTKEMTTDYSYIASKLQNKMLTKGLLFLDKELWSGDGNDSTAANHIYGLKGHATAFTAAKSGLALLVDKPTVVDVIEAARLQCAVIDAANLTDAGGYTPNVLFINPVTMSKIRLAKGTDGNYLVNRLADGTLTLNGLTIIESNAVGVNELMVMDSSVAEVYFKQNPEIQIGQEATDLTQDQYTIVMFLRAQLVIEGPDKLGLVLVSDIAAAITALTKPAA
jgi:HK97 family phage major capsid protein